MSRGNSLKTGAFDKFVTRVNSLAGAPDKVTAIMTGFNNALSARGEKANITRLSAVLMMAGMTEEFTTGGSLKSDAFNRIIGVLSFAASSEGKTIYSQIKTGLENALSRSGKRAEVSGTMVLMNIIGSREQRTSRFDFSAGSVPTLKAGAFNDVINKLNLLGTARGRTAIDGIRSGLNASLRRMGRTTLSIESVVMMIVSSPDKDEKFFIKGSDGKLSLNASGIMSTVERLNQVAKVMSPVVLNNYIGAANAVLKAKSKPEINATGLLLRIISNDKNFSSGNKINAGLNVQFTRDTKIFNMALASGFDTRRESIGGGLSIARFKINNIKAIASVASTKHINDAFQRIGINVSSVQVFEGSKLIGTGRIEFGGKTSTDKMGIVGIDSSGNKFVVLRSGGKTARITPQMRMTKEVDKSKLKGTTDFIRQTKGLEGTSVTVGGVTSKVENISFKRGTIDLAGTGFGSQLDGTQIAALDKALGFGTSYGAVLELEDGRSVTVELFGSRRGMGANISTGLVGFRMLGVTKDGKYKALGSDEASIVIVEGFAIENSKVTAVSEPILENNFKLKDLFKSAVFKYRRVTTVETFADVSGLSQITAGRFSLSENASVQIKGMGISVTVDIKDQKKRSDIFI